MFVVLLVIDPTSHELGSPAKPGRFNEALALIESRRIDAAILDVNLDAETTFPVALVLEQREVPFVFVTGAVPEDIPERYFKFVLGKPSTLQAIGQALFGLSRH